MIGYPGAVSSARITEEFNKGFLRRSTPQKSFIFIERVQL
jgi:hypothetical protein